MMYHLDREDDGPDALLPILETRGLGGLSRMEDRADLKLGDEMPCGFGMVPLRLHPAVLDALQRRALWPRDLGVLWALACHVEWRTGRAFVSTGQLAAELGWREHHLASHSLSRLRRLGLINRGEASVRGLYWLIRPDVFCFGGPLRREAHCWQWLASLPPERRERDRLELLGIGAGEGEGEAMELLALEGAAAVP
jgi:hypothetical protein